MARQGGAAGRGVHRPTAAAAALTVLMLLPLAAASVRRLPTADEWAGRVVYQVRSRPRLGAGTRASWPCRRCRRRRCSPPPARPLLPQIVTDRFAGPEVMPANKGTKCTNLNNYCGGTWQGILDRRAHNWGAGGGSSAPQPPLAFGAHSPPEIGP